MIEKLPVTLRDLPPRAVHGPQFAVAWGLHAVILECGVDRPETLQPNSYDHVNEIGVGAKYVLWLNTGQVFTAIDRSVYIRVTIPSMLSAFDYLTPLSTDISAALPAICVAQPADGTTLPPVRELCTHRQ